MTPDNIAEHESGTVGSDIYIVLRPAPGDAIPIVRLPDKRTRFAGSAIAETFIAKPALEFGSEPIDVERDDRPYPRGSNLSVNVDLVRDNDRTPGGERFNNGDAEILAVTRESENVRVGKGGDAVGPVDRTNDHDAILQMIVSDELLHGRPIPFSVGPGDNEHGVREIGAGKSGNKKIEAFFRMNTTQEKNNFLAFELGMLLAESPRRGKVLKFAEVNTVGLDDGGRFEMKRLSEVGFKRGGEMQARSAIEITAQTPRHIKFFLPFRLTKTPWVQHAAWAYDIRDFAKPGCAGRLMLNLFKERMDVNHITPGHKVINPFSQLRMARHGISAWAKKMDLDAGISHFLRLVVAGMVHPGSRDGDIQTGAKLGRRQAGHRDRRATVDRVQAGNEVTDFQSAHEFLIGHQGASTALKKFGMLSVM